MISYFLATFTHASINIFLLTSKPCPPTCVCVGGGGGVQSVKGQSPFFLLAIQPVLFFSLGGMDLDGEREREREKREDMDVVVCASASVE